MIKIIENWKIEELVMVTCKVRIPQGLVPSNISIS